MTAARTTGAMAQANPPPRWFGGFAITGRHPRPRAAWLRPFACRSWGLARVVAITALFLPGCGGDPLADATRPPPPPTPSRADVEADFPPPGTGALLAPRKGGKGLGELTVSNGTASDAIVKLSREGEATAVVFVHAADETTVKGIAPGTYDIQFSLGIGYDPGTRRFVRNDGFQEFDPRERLRWPVGHDRRPALLAKSRICLECGSTTGTGHRVQDWFSAIYYLYYAKYKNYYINNEI
jgi:hypothetical protein